MEVDRLAYADKEHMFIHLQYGDGTDEICSIGMNAKGYYINVRIVDSDGNIVPENNKYDCWFLEQGVYTLIYSCCDKDLAEMQITVSEKIEDVYSPIQKAEITKANEESFLYLEYISAYGYELTLYYENGDQEVLSFCGNGVVQNYYKDIIQPKVESDGNIYKIVFVCNDIILAEQEVTVRGQKPLDILTLPQLKIGETTIDEYYYVFSPICSGVYSFYGLGCCIYDQNMSEINRLYPPGIDYMLENGEKYIVQFYQTEGKIKNTKRRSYTIQDTVCCFR